MVAAERMEAKLIIVVKIHSIANISSETYVLFSFINGDRNMEISQLEVFLAVAREGGFSRAAEKLYRTQSAVSQAIRKLEAEIGEPLFDRSTRDGVMTDAGNVLQEYAERLLNLRENAREALAELRELQKGKLVVGANEFTALYLLRVLAEFRRLHPAIRIVVQRSLGSHIPDDIRRHNCEFGVLTYDPQDPELASVVVYSDELIFVVPPQHPLARESQVSIRQLGAESFVAHIVSSPYREKVIQAFEKHKTPLHMGVELPTLQAIKRFVAMGNGVAFLPEISVEDEIARGELVRIPVQELRVHRKLRLIYRKSAALSHAGRAFLKIAESVADTQGGRYRFERSK
jgi:DNA-binding transcriptional LysR family regulator